MKSRTSKFHALKTMISTLLLLTFSTVSFAHWVLNSEKSTLHYTSIKNGSVAENNQFKVLSGEANDETGVVNVSIDLASVDTGIKIRDQRMRMLLFVVQKNPTAELSVKVAKNMVANLAVGESNSIEAEIAVSLNGKSKNYKTMLRILKTKAHEIMVISEMPITVFAKDFDFENGIAQLQKLAGLKSINRSVPVTATLVFSEDHPE